MARPLESSSALFVLLVACGSPSAEMDATIGDPRDGGASDAADAANPRDAHVDAGRCLEVTSVEAFRLDVDDDTGMRIRARFSPEVEGEPWDLYVWFQRFGDSTFDGAGRWKGTRKGSPWNGRTWPVVNSHILEGLTYWAERGNKKAQRLSNQLLDRTITMMSGQLEGLEQPTAFEHYHPEHGIGSRYRGVDLNLNAFMLDNIFRIGCGFAVRYGEVQDDPIGDARDFKLKGMPLGNKLFDVERKSGKLKVSSQ